MSVALFWRLPVDCKEEILSRIPHRPPFLWLDRIVLLTAEHIVAEKEISADLDFFAGHYPGYPIVPGVLLCEAVFQAGAVLISRNIESLAVAAQGVPVLTRITGARFKRPVRPGETIIVVADIKEKIGPAWFLKGRVKIGDEVAVSVEFACAMAPLSG